jgi:hypothetical protein
VGTPPRKTNNQTAAAIGALGGAAACAAGGATAPRIGVCAAAGAALAPAIEDFGTGVGELASGQFSTCKGSCDAHTAADVQALLAKIPNVAMTQPLRDCIKAKCAEKFASAPPPPSSAIQNQQFIANGAARLFGTTAATSSPQSRIFGNR